MSGGVAIQSGRGAIALMNAHRISDADDADLYPTQPWGARAGGELIKLLDPRAIDAWECACGPGHMAYGLEPYFDHVRTSDRFDYGGNRLYDFTSDAPPPFRCDWVVTNPPFKHAGAFIRKAWDRADRGVALLMRAAALESIGRHSVLFGCAPLTVFAPFSERLPMHKERLEPDGSTAAFYAWFVFLKPPLEPQRFMVRIGDQLWPATMPIGPGTRRRLTRAGDRKRWGCA